MRADHTLAVVLGLRVRIGSISATPRPATRAPEGRAEGRAPRESPIVPSAERQTPRSVPSFAVMGRSRPGRRHGPSERARRLPGRPSPSSIRETSERSAGPPGEGYPVAAVWSGWGGPGRAGVGAVGARRQSEVGEDGTHDRRVLHGGDDAQPAATAGAGQDIEIEHAVHQRRPVQAGVGPGLRGRALSSGARPPGAGRP